MLPRVTKERRTGAETGCQVPPAAAVPARISESASGEISRKQSSAATKLAGVYTTTVLDTQISAAWLARIWNLRTRRVEYLPPTPPPPLAAADTTSLLRWSFSSDAPKEAAREEAIEDTIEDTIEEEVEVDVEVDVEVEVEMGVEDNVDVAKLPPILDRSLFLLLPAAPLSAST